jgi:hypothetical protein
MGWPVPQDMGVAHDGNGYEPKGWFITGLLLAYSGLLLAYFASLSSEQCVSRSSGWCNYGLLY